MNRRNQYLLGVFAVAPVWFAISICLCRMLDRVTVTSDMETTASWWLKLACGAAYPVRYLLPEDGFAGLSERANDELGLFLMLVNSILWGFLLVFLFRFGARLYSAWKTGIPNAAQPLSHDRSDTTLSWRS
jgi:hypothetical protein